MLEIVYDFLKIFSRTAGGCVIRIVIDFWVLTYSSRSAVYSVKIIGLRIPPWGTPEFSSTKPDSIFPILTLCFLSDKKELNHLIVCSVNPKSSSFLHRRLMSRVSKAADRSHIRIPVFCFSSLLTIQSFCMCEWAVIVDLFCLNPCWLSGRRPFVSMKWVFSC